MSFSDKFEFFDDSLWIPYSSIDDMAEVNTSVDALLADDGDGIQFTNSSVDLVRSVFPITFPMRVRATVQKRAAECNAFSIGLGPTWESRSEYSTRVNWQCLGGNSQQQWSLYNDSFRLYDPECWDGSTDTKEVMEVSYTLQNRSDNLSWYKDSAPVARVATNASDYSCASLQNLVIDISKQNPWQDAYLWFGTLPRDDYYYYPELASVNDSIIGRFTSMAYTQFFTDFDGDMTHIWSAADAANLSLDTFPEQDGLSMAAGQKLRYVNVYRQMYE